MLDDPTLAATGGSGSIPQGEGGVVLRRGDSLDRFVIIDELGRGAMGTVYAAFDTKLERQVAVKLLHSANRGIGSLLAEAQALARINHPNVVTVHDVGEHEGRLFLAMELVRGKRFGSTSGRRGNCGATSSRTIGRPLAGWQVFRFGQIRQARSIPPIGPKPPSNRCAIFCWLTIPTGRSG